MAVERWRSRRVVLMGGALVLAALLAAAWDWRRTGPDGRLHIIAPALKGDALLLVTPNGHTVLIDGSGDAVGMTAFVGGRLPFWARSLDALVLTRADPGRLPGALAIARRYSLGVALLPDGDAAELAALREELTAERASIRPVGDAALEIDGVKLSVVQAATDDAGATLLVRYGAFSALLAPAAADGAAEKLLSGAPTAALLWWPWTRPDDRRLAERIGAAAVIYSQSDSGRQEPRTMLQRGGDQRRLLHEEVSGQIEIVTDGAAMWVETER